MITISSDMNLRHTYNINLNVFQLLLHKGIQHEIYIKIVIVEQL
jgi:hypothetical protein